MPLLIRNARVIVTGDKNRPRLHGGSILIEGQRIIAIGPDTEIKAPSGVSVIDASNHAVVPGFVNTHHHLYQVLTRVLPEVQNAKLFDWLIGLYEVWRELTPRDVYLGALAGLGELLLTGCTTTTDHHYVFPRGRETGMIEEQVRAAQTLGIRFHPTRGSMSRGRSLGGLPPDDVCQTPDEILRDSQRLIEKFHDPKPLAMTRLALAPCSPFSVTPELMRDTAVLARERGVRLHTHLAETQDETDYCIKIYGKRPVALMEELGWLGPDVWFAHCVHLNDSEIRQFAETGTGVAHCPSSNMRLASGIAPIPKMIQAGVPVGLAVDGSSSNDSSDMLGEARQALLLHRVLGGAGAIGADDVFDLASKGGARVLGYEKEIGVLAPGWGADLAMFRVDRLPYAGASVHDPAAALLFCGASHIADVVVCNGRVVVEGGRLVFAEEDQIVAQANQAARELVDRAQARKR